MNAVVSPLAPVARETMDREFIEKNQIVERYLLGKLPPRGVSDFERVCRENPALVDEIGLAERVHRAVKLIEASGQPELWQEKPKQAWEKPGFVFATGAALLLAVVGAAVLAASCRMPTRGSSNSNAASSSARSIRPAAGAR